VITKNLWLAALFFALVTSGIALGSPPNVLLIVADDMGYSDIGPFGGEIATPTLDTLAQEGLRLANFHVLASCSPSRSVLLSGMDNHRAGLGTMNERMSDDIRGKPGYEGHLNHRVAALPEVLKANGYRTYMVGKWHLGEDKRTLPHARGFDETFVLVDGGGSHWADSKWITPTIPMSYSRNGKEVDSLPEDFYSSKDYTDALIEWIKRDQGNDQPFFAYLAYTAPHDPLQAPKEYIDKYKGVYDGGWDNLRGKRLQRLKELGIIEKNAVYTTAAGIICVANACKDLKNSASLKKMPNPFHAYLQLRPGRSYPKKNGRWQPATWRFTPPWWIIWMDRSKGLLIS